MCGQRPEVLKLRAPDRDGIAKLLNFHRMAGAELVSGCDAAQLLLNASDLGLAVVHHDDIELECHYAGFIAQILHDIAPGRHLQQRGLGFECIAKYECGCTVCTNWNQSGKWPKNTSIAA